MSRSLPAVQVSKQFRPYGAEQTQQPDWYVCDFDYSALLVSQNHYHLPSGGWSGGGPFYCQKAKCRHYGAQRIPQFKIWGNETGPINLIGVGDPIVYRPPNFGTVHAVPVQSRSGAIDELVALQSDNYAKGINRTRPGQPEASLGTFLSELKSEGIPSLPGKPLISALKSFVFPRNSSGSIKWGAIIPGLLARLRGFLHAQRVGGPKAFLRNGPQEYLNYEFGWAPFVNDLREVYNLARRINEVLEKLARENNKNLRRRASLGNTTTTEDLGTWSVPWPAWNVGGGSIISAAPGWTYLRGVRITTTRTWFVAGYRYSIQDTNSWLWRGKAVAVLFGAFPTPQTLYDATPWTWLIDWFEDIGDIVAYFSPSAVDALVTRYAYTMRHRVTKSDWTAYTKMDAFTGGSHSWGSMAGVFRSTYEVEEKMRGAGWAPFGTSLGTSPLTLRQAAILAAIGITRSSPGS